MNEIIKKQGVGLALSGGGSRAIAFHYGVFEAFHKLKVDQKIDVVSAISGGAVIGALWAVYSKDWNAFCEKTELVLEEGLEAPLIERLKNPIRMLSMITRKGLDADELADVLDKKILSGMKLVAIPERPTLILNAADLTTGSNFKFSREVIGSYRVGGHVLPDVTLSQAVAYSAGFPLCFLPKKLELPNKKCVYLVDGGAYDCIGANALMPDKDDKISILTQKCETIIISDASAPFSEKDSGWDDSVFNGLYGSYLTSAHRNKALIYNKMYILHEKGEIPHIGTIKMDSKHPDLKLDWNDEDRDMVNKYKTNFKPVSGRALQLLKQRGKESAEFIVTRYLTHLLK